MNSVGGIFHQRNNAWEAADALVYAGVAAESLRVETLPRSLIDVLGPLGVPSEAITEYERDVVPGDVLLVVTTDRLPAEAIANEIAHAGGLVVEYGRAPTTGKEIR
jgi:hypothetical protein